VKEQLHAFLTSVLGEGEWSASRPRPLYSQESSTRYPLDRRLGGPQNRSGFSGEEKNFLPRPCRESKPGRPAHSL